MEIAKTAGSFFSMQQQLSVITFFGVLFFLLKFFRDSNVYKFFERRRKFE